jgi:hypothetical protein
MALMVLLGRLCCLCLGVLAGCLLLVVCILQNMQCSLVGAAVCLLYTSFLCSGDVPPVRMSLAESRSVHAVAS